MTRALSDLLRDVAKALTGYASLKHTQSKFPQHPGIQAALLEEVAYIEALEREVRDAAQAQAAAGGEIAALRDEHEALQLAEHSHHPTNRRLRVCIQNLVYELELHQRNVERIGYMRERVKQARGTAASALAQAQAGAGEGQGEGEGA